MTIILENTNQIDFQTDLSKIIVPFRQKFINLNWLLTDLDFIVLDSDKLGDVDKLNHDDSSIKYSGQELNKIIDTRQIQFNWGVLTGFSGDIPEIPEDKLPFADQNDTLWTKPEEFQISSAEIEIICWDSSSTIIKFKDQNLADNFLSAYADSKVLKNAY